MVAEWLRSGFVVAGFASATSKLRNPKIDIGRWSPTFPVTPPCVRLRTRRFGQIHFLIANVGGPSEMKEAFGRTIESAGLRPRCHSDDLLDAATPSSARPPLTPRYPVRVPGSRVCSTLPSDPASRRRPCASLTLHLHQVESKTFTSPPVVHARHKKKPRLAAGVQALLDGAGRDAQGRVGTPERFKEDFKRR